MPIATRKILISEDKQGQDTLSTLYFAWTYAQIMLLNFPVLLSYWEVKLNALIVANLQHHYALEDAYKCHIRHL